MTKSRASVRDTILISLFAALTAVLSQIVIPLPFTPIPLNLATLSIFLAGGLLGAKRGAASQLIYGLLGAFGVPVFTGFSGGFGIVVGPRGGFIVGYIVAAFVIGTLRDMLPRKPWGYGLAMAAGAVCYFTLGAAWFGFVANVGLFPSITMCVLPFLPGDCFKIIIASYLVDLISKNSMVNNYNV